MYDTQIMQIQSNSIDLLCIVLLVHTYISTREAITEEEKRKQMYVHIISFMILAMKRRCRVIRNEKLAFEIKINKEDDKRIDVSQSPFPARSAFYCNTIDSDITGD